MEMKKFMVLKTDTMQVEESVVLESESLKFMQENVDGHIERYSGFKELSDAKIDMFLNEDGIEKALKPTIVIFNKDFELLELLIGNIVFAGNDGERTIGLDAEQRALVTEFLSNEALIGTEDMLIQVKAVMAHMPK